MKLGFIGLGKMGSQMVVRLLDAGHEVIVKDINQDSVAAMQKHGASPANSHAELAQQLGPKAVAWVMIPEQFVGAELIALAEHLDQQSIVIDGGNSDYSNTLKHAEQLAQKDIELVDIGTSGGVHGRENGFSMMVGGSKAAVEHVNPIINDLAQKDGWGHVGPTSAGHYTKMIHNGIEYGIMQAYAEGYQLAKEGPVPDIDLGLLARIWQHGSINESFLNGLIETMLTRDPKLSNVEGYVHDSGEARWTLETAKAHNIAMPVTQAALDVRVASQNGETSYATQFLAQLRNEFGGHAINKEGA